MYTAENKLDFQTKIKEQLKSFELVMDGEYRTLRWVMNLPKLHPKALRMNSVSQYIWIATSRDLLENPNSLIPKLPDWTYPPYYAKFVDMIVHDNMVWQMGLTTAFCAKADIRIKQRLQLEKMFSTNMILFDVYAHSVSC